MKNKAKNVVNYIIFAGITTMVFLTVVIIPFLYGVYLTLTDWNGIEATKKYIGIRNYISILNDSTFLYSFTLTLKYVFFSVLFINLIAFLLAYLLTSGIKGQNVFRIALFTPNLIGGIVLGFIWQFIFNNTLPYIGQKIGLGLISNSWLASPQKAFWALVIVTVWQYSGYMMMIYIAGLVGIPQDIIEASTIDGAGQLTRITKIILPLLAPSFTVSVFLSLQRSFMVYDLNLALTKGGPFRSTELVSMHVYSEAFLSQNYGIGQAKAIILFITVAIITSIQVYLSKKAEVEA
ncbi:binding-protein-dependent transport systems inner membrane component [Caldicellulosiruptor hydrothermalis 108]|uniref:Binding-protein-dependent transport systems inner membrane component n=1 Tax=Caldicellulosiruptor hydrothermalis (strain DSM 18901 / VKM B-2411 / 108) TaxID=632292 RepID=E4Q7X6_CALH1|nr:sugar ABC transporter permease [Caldicellulosiruptor hydrothermalis]ADQ07894.1 binding-protein-dependent transport systems inner membrane component [Caldicellulosiruptor hydrothermalis 108]